MSQRYVLDAWALLAMLQGEEPAASRVRQLLAEGEQRQVDLRLSIVNLGEVYYRIGKRSDRATAQGTISQIRRLPLTIVSATDELVWAAAELKMKFALCYADAFAAALAASTDAILVSGDLELDRVCNYVKLEKLQRSRS
jgi:ribonuclease VapC